MEWNKGGLPAWGAAAIVVVTLGLAWWLIPGMHQSSKDDVKFADIIPKDAFPSTYKPRPSKPTLIRGATVLTGTDKEIVGGDVLMQDGKIKEVGQNIPAPQGAVVVDGKGKFVTPGIIDIHSHLGVYPSPANEAMSDGNEATKPTTPEVRAENSV